MESTENKLKLSDSDKKNLKSEGNKMIVALVIFMIFSVIIGIVAKLTSDTYGVLIAVFIIIVIPLTAFVFIYRIFYVSDLRKGYKIVISGTISDKNIKTYSTPSTASIDEMNQTSTQTYFYFMIDMIEFLVTEEYFNKFQTGDFVEIHQTASGVFMYAKGNLDENLEDNQNDFFQIEPLNENETIFFKDYRYKKIKKTLTRGFIFGFISYWIIIFIGIFAMVFFRVNNDDMIIRISEVLLIFVILSIIFVMNKELFVAFYLDTKEKNKSVKVVKVSDKFLSNINLTDNEKFKRSSDGFHYIKSGLQQYSVHHEIYNDIKIGEKVIITEVLHSKLQLNIELV